MTVLVLQGWRGGRVQVPSQLTLQEAFCLPSEFTEVRWRRDLIKQGSSIFQRGLDAHLKGTEYLNGIVLYPFLTQETGTLLIPWKLDIWGSVHLFLKGRCSVQSTTENQTSKHPESALFLLEAANRVHCALPDMRSSCCSQRVRCTSSFRCRRH